MDSADRWILKILSVNPPLLGPPERTPFTEEGPVTLKFANLPEDAMITLKRRPEGFILNPFDNNRPSPEITFPASLLDDQGSITLTIGSDVATDYICIFASVMSSGTPKWTVSPISGPRSDR